MAEVLANHVRCVTKEVPGSFLEGKDVTVVYASDDRVVLQDIETGELFIIWAAMECETRDCDGDDDPWIYLRFTVRR